MRSSQALRKRELSGDTSLGNMIASLRRPAACLSRFSTNPPQQVFVHVSIKRIMAQICFCWLCLNPSTIIRPLKSTIGISIYARACVTFFLATLLRAAISLCLLVSHLQFNIADVAQVLSRCQLPPDAHHNWSVECDES